MLLVNQEQLETYAMKTSAIKLKLKIENFDLCAPRTFDAEVAIGEFLFLHSGMNYKTFANSPVETPMLVWEKLSTLCGYSKRRVLVRLLAWKKILIQVMYVHLNISPVVSVVLKFRISSIQLFMTTARGWHLWTGFHLLDWQLISATCSTSCTSPNLILGWYNFIELIRALNMP